MYGSTVLYIPYRVVVTVTATGHCRMVLEGAPTSSFRRIAQHQQNYFISASYHLVENQTAGMGRLAPLPLDGSVIRAIRRTGLRQSSVPKQCCWGWVPKVPT